MKFWKREFSLLLQNFKIIPESKQTDELLEPMTYSRGDREIVAKAVEQLLNTLSLLEALADGKLLLFLLSFSGEENGISVFIK